MTEFKPDRQMLLTHFEACAHVTALLNKTVEFASAPDDSPEEEATQASLNETVAALATMPPGDVGTLLMALSMMIIQTSDHDRVQAWMNEQAVRVYEGLGE